MAAATGVGAAVSITALGMGPGGTTIVATASLLPPAVALLRVTSLIGCSVARMTSGSSTRAVT